MSVKKKALADRAYTFGVYLLAVLGFASIWFSDLKTTNGNVAFLLGAVACWLAGYFMRHCK